MDSPIYPESSNGKRGAYSEVVLGEEAVAHIYDILLSVKERGLVSMLLEHLDFHTGSITTFLPNYVDKDAYRNLRMGRKLTSIVEEWLIDRMMAHLNKYDNAICVLDESLSRPTDPGLIRFMDEHPERPFKFHGDEVYQACLQPDPEDLSWAWSSANEGVLSFGVMTRVSDKSKWGTTSEILMEDLREAARNTEYLFVNAYDGEGYLIWNR